MPNEERKMAFWEVAQGSFAKEFQGDFEKAQTIAKQRGVVVQVAAMITIYPEKKDTPNFGGVEFQTHIKQPPKKSMRYPTKIKQGLMVKDGHSIDEINQLNLDLPEVKQKVFVPEQDRASVMDLVFNPEKHDRGPEGTIVDKATGEVVG